MKVSGSRSPPRGQRAESGGDSPGWCQARMAAVATASPLPRRAPPHNDSSVAIPPSPSPAPTLFPPVGAQSPAAARGAPRQVPQRTAQLSPGRCHKQLGQGLPSRQIRLNSPGGAGERKQPLRSLPSPVSGQAATVGPAAALILRTPSARGEGRGQAQAPRAVPSAPRLMSVISAAAPRASPQGAGQVPCGRHGDTSRGHLGAVAPGRGGTCR